MDIFVDGLGDIRLHAGMVRIDFVVHDADPAQPGAHHRAARLIMTPQGLLQVAQGLARAASQLQQPPAAEPAAPLRPSSLAPDVPGRSPNFHAP